MIVKNEQNYLGSALQSITGLVDEIIIVDTGSEDRTKQIAEGFGAKVFDFPWTDDFASARNECLRHATGQWILSLDADEQIDKDNQQRFRSLLDSLKKPGCPPPRELLSVPKPLVLQIGDKVNSYVAPENEEASNVAYFLKWRCPPDSVTGTTLVVDHVRIFRRLPEHMWSYRVHEQILPSLMKNGAKFYWVDIYIDHFGYSDQACLEQKLARNLRLLEQDYLDDPNDPFTLFNIGETYQGLGNKADSLFFLRRCIDRAKPQDPIVPKALALLGQCLRRLGQLREALGVCHKGRQGYPADAELLYLEGQLHREVGNVPEAIACFRRLVDNREKRECTKRLGDNQSSVEDGINGFLARHQLAMLYRHQGRLKEAEVEWQLALGQCPKFGPAKVGLSALYLSQG
jgi:glycosyltransferase involved in cell wall biosynthesis